MALIAFKSINFNALSRRYIDQCNQILARYAALGLRMTLRQLYYQMVTANVIVNSQRSYKRLGELVSNARLAGKIDWDAIEDRVRVPSMPDEYTGIQHLLTESIAKYRKQRWKEQPYYIELWVEKDALANVLWPLAEEFHIVLMVNRGYSSQSAMYESALRFGRKVNEGKLCHLYYLGDFDPSGNDMVRDIRERFDMFGLSTDAISVHKIALTMDQIRDHELPPNPLKVTDPRAVKYEEEFGDESWEVDALPPDVLQAEIRLRIEPMIDKKLMTAVLAKETRDKVRLKKATKKLKD